MPKTATMSLRIDPAVKSDVEAIYARYGLSITEAINVFLHQSRNIGGLPFDLRPPVPNAETLAAMKEADEMAESGKARFNNFGDMLKDLKS
ncbi:MAG: type II toxin-antitoxin system RelB/DinJ family antitoxin [Candidatus Adiutrix sp.]|jgi:DNA-damage-inducible protein J|nr:type II toxin-antitoxin system RelB/DinJ family antitoxin [Candidatus Adiutrix sp.]